MLPHTHKFILASISRSLALGALGALLAGCITTTDGPSQEVPEGPWVMPSPLLQSNIDRHLELLPYLQSLSQFQAEIGFFVKVGEPGYPAMLDLIENGGTKTAGIALSVISSTGDVRLVPYLKKIPWPAEDQRLARYERARCHVSLGDWAPMDILLEGLRDEGLWPRALTFKTLRKVTNHTFGYRPQEEDRAIRDAAASRWDEWYEGIQADALR